MEVAAVLMESADTPQIIAEQNAFRIARPRPSAENTRQMDEPNAD
jgi:hypothetical protein